VSFFAIISRRGYRIYFHVRLRPVWRCRKKGGNHLKTKPTGTRGRFVSSILLRIDIAVVAGIASAAVHVAII
jgi:hypothetical protein